MKYYNLKYYFLFLIFGTLFHLELYAQIQNKEVLMDKNINKLIYSDPKKAIEITQSLLNQPNLKDQEKSKLIFQIAKAYKVKGEFSKALKFLYQESIYKNHLSKNELIEIEIEKADILLQLSFFDEAKKIIASVEESYTDETDKDLKFYFEAWVNIEKAEILYQEEDYAPAIALLETTNLKNNNKFPEVRFWYDVLLGKLYYKKLNQAISRKHYEKALKYIDDFDKENIYARVHVTSGLAALAFQNKDYEGSNKLLNEVYGYAVQLDNLLLQELVIRMLNINYLALNDIENYKLATTKLAQLSNSIELLNQESVNSVFNLISEQQANISSKKETVYYNIAYGLLAILIVLFLVFFIIWFRGYQSRARLQNVISYLEITRNNFLDKLPFTKEKPKKVAIPKETEELILSKLKKFETTKKFTNKDISLAVLAGQFDTNTKYLSEVINTHYQINFNTYINKLRVNYIVEKIKKDANFKNYKISYLAEVCGFSSHSSFATVFKSITGLSPITFIDLIKNERENITEI